jgi:AcrR family transcriptional regulator
MLSLSTFSGSCAQNMEQATIMRREMRKKKPYHHSNLREVLLASAVQLIAEAGPSGFTLREVARRAGVSHNAPYRHFQDRDALLAAVAAQGYLELNNAMIEAADQASDPLNRLKRAGLAYVAFALRRAEHFTVMFETDLSKESYPEAEAASGLAFSTLVGLVEGAQSSRQMMAGDSLQLAFLAWSMVHGIAKLAITGRLPHRSKTKILEFAEFVIDHSLPGSA